LEQLYIHFDDDDDDDDDDTYFSILTGNYISDGKQDMQYVN